MSVLRYVSPLCRSELVHSARRRKTVFGTTRLVRRCSLFRQAENLVTDRWVGLAGEQVHPVVIPCDPSHALRDTFVENHVSCANGLLQTTAIVAPLDALPPRHSEHRHCPSGGVFPNTDTAPHTDVQRIPPCPSWTVRDFGRDSYVINHDSSPRPCVERSSEPGQTQLPANKDKPPGINLAVTDTTGIQPRENHSKRRDMA